MRHDWPLSFGKVGNQTDEIGKLEAKKMAGRYDITTVNMDMEPWMVYRL